MRRYTIKLPTYDTALPLGGIPPRSSYWSLAFPVLTRSFSSPHRRGNALVLSVVLPFWACEVSDIEGGDGVP